MTLRISAPPPEATGAVISRLQTMQAQPQDSRRALGGSEPSALTLEVPHAVYTVGLQELLSGEALSRSAPSGWRYLLVAGESAVSSADTAATAAGGHKVSHITSGPFVASTVEALRSAEALPLVQDEDVEPRLLSVPGLHLMALWIHGKEQDVLIPLAPAPPGLQPNQAYAPDELLDIVRPEAQERVSIGPADQTGG